MTRDTAISISTSLRRNKGSVLLMKDISFPRIDEMSWWVADGFVPVEYVKKFKLYETFNISTYTWYNSTAKSLLYEGTATYMHDVYGYKNIVYHRFTEMKRAVYGWNHYHVGTYNVLKGYAEAVSKALPIHQVHSFFGLAYIRLADNQGFASYPSNP